MLKAANATVLPLHGDQLLESDGDKRLRRIAKAGREWKQTVGRKVDMESECCIMYRLV